MPNIAIWNIENFGATGQKNRRGDYLGLLEFIRAVISWKNVEVLVIQEFKAAGKKYLPVLQALLNREESGNPWNFDYLPGALLNDTRPNIKFHDLAYTTTGNTEGYAVIWKGETLKPFSNSMSFHGTLSGNSNRSFINLVSSGAAIMPQPKESIPLLAGLGNMEPLGFPLPKCKGISVSKKRARSGSATNDAITLETINELTLSRCPCQFQINQGGKSIPMVVYHAPNGTNSSFYGTLLTGLSNPLREASFSEGIVAGDFNMTSAYQVKHGFSNLTNITMVAGTQPNAQGEYPPTMIKYVKSIFKHDTLIPENDKNTCFGDARDQLFYRLNTAPKEVGRLDLISALSSLDSKFDTSFSNQVLGSSAIQQMVTSPSKEDYQKFDELFSIPEGINALNILKDSFTIDGKFKDYRSVAIFLNLFISDHLPLFIAY